MKIRRGDGDEKSYRLPEGEDPHFVYIGSYSTSDIWPPAAHRRRRAVPADARRGDDPEHEPRISKKPLVVAKVRAPAARRPS
ncbi:hypothetical protein ACRAWD_10815 [Caulobacter segnis]